MGSEMCIRDSYKAAERGHGEVVRILLDVVDPLNAIRYPGGFSPLYKAAREGNIAALEILLEDGRLPFDGRTEKGITPLFAAAAEGRFACVAALLRSGADASITNIDGLLPVDVASRNGHDEVATILTGASRVRTSPRRRRSGSSSPPARRWRASRRARRWPRGLRRAGVSRRRPSY